MKSFSGVYCRFPKNAGIFNRPLFGGQYTSIKSGNLFLNEFAERISVIWHGQMQYSTNLQFFTKIRFLFNFGARTQKELVSYKLTMREKFHFEINVQNRGNTVPHVDQRGYNCMSGVS
jgi:hypothetical protein